MRRYHSSDAIAGNLRASHCCHARRYIRDNRACAPDSYASGHTTNRAALDIDAVGARIFCARR